MARVVSFEVEKDANRHRRETTARFMGRAPEQGTPVLNPQPGTIEVLSARDEMSPARATKLEKSTRATSHERVDAPRTSSPLC
jgi:hypothetical protein